MIYDLNYKQLKKEMFEFGKSFYGKCIFISCYTPFFISLIITIVSAVKTFSCDFSYNLKNFIFFPIVTIVLICLGSIGYYKELRVFVNSKENGK